MLLVIATLPGKPEKREELAALLAAGAQASRQEDGCLSYSFAADVEDENRFVSIESWQDQASLDTHFGQPHLAALLQKAPELLSGAPVITVHEVGSSRTL